MAVTSSVLLLAASILTGTPGGSSVLDKPTQLANQTFWDNRDWDWYAENIPFFECPDADVTTTYYYRWELLTKHLTYGSPNTGYVFTEFIDRPFWSGAYGAISCPAGHQIYEARWLRSPRVARDYATYWFRTPGAQPRNYSTWLADAVRALGRVHPERGGRPGDRFGVGLLPDLVRNYEGWEARHFVPEVGLFWQTGHDDGMEYNINSRQTADIVRGAPGYRPSFNAYMWADAKAIAAIARDAGDGATAALFESKAGTLKEKLQGLLWDDRRRFFLQAYKNDEERDGFRIRAGTRTYESGRFAGDAHGRELIGYVPWQFGLPDKGKGYERAWAFLMDSERFFAPFGPATVERGDPMFLLQKTCCWWSGQSWPYATAQTLKALANLLQEGEPQPYLTKGDYARLLGVYARTHRKAGVPYIAEACHPDTGSWEGHDSEGHSEHYFHSGYCDLVITGLVGLVPRDDEVLELKPLAPESWDWWALDDVVYRGRNLSIVWDRTGEHYGRGKGLRVLADGREIAASETLGPLRGDLPPLPPASGFTDPAPKIDVNFAVNNDGTPYPRIAATAVGAGTSPMKLIDGNYWYHVRPANRWTAEGSPNDSDDVTIDFGMERPLNALKLYFLDDGAGAVPPREYAVEVWQGGAWSSIADQRRTPETPTGRRANTVRFPELRTSKVRVRLVHADGGRSGLTELEAWGRAKPPVDPAPEPPGNLARRREGADFPKTSASFTSRFDKVEEANDGRISFLPTPRNRWTCYESPNAEDWLAIDFGKPTTVGRVELAIFDDRGGVQAPASCEVQFREGEAWKAVENATREPKDPIGGTMNTVTFRPVTTPALRVVFRHRGAARSGVSEIQLFER